MTYKVVFLGSTGGGVLSRLVQHEFVKEIAHEAAADRDCGVLDVAAACGMANIKLPANSGQEFSDALQRRYEGMPNLIFLSFYTRLLKPPFLERRKGLLFNCHPSLLPSFKGMKGFEETVESNSLFMGCSLHQIDAGVDTGDCVIQAAIPIDRSLAVGALRHKLFLAQYYSALQFLSWVKQGRLVVDKAGRASIQGSIFGVSPFSPNLDPDFFNSCGISNELT